MHTSQKSAKESDFAGLITHAFLIKLRDDTSLPRVKGSDDADKARWVAISDLKPEDFFEDHWHIIQNMIARI